MKDRQSENPGRVKITFDDGTVRFGTIERADNPSVEGTPLNKNTLFNSENSERFDCELPSEAFKAIGMEWQFTVPLTGYSASVDAEGYYTIDIPLEGMSEKYNPKFSPLYANASGIDDIDESFNFIKRIITSDGKVTMKVTEPPLTAFTLRLWGV